MTIDANFSIENRTLIIRNNKGIIKWKGKPKNMDVVALNPIIASGSCVVLLDSLQAEKLKTRNLLRINHKGKIEWEVGSPSKSILKLDRKYDYYVRIYKSGEKFLEVNSWLGFLDTIDINSGIIKDSEFVK